MTCISIFNIKAGIFLISYRGYTMNALIRFLIYFFFIANSLNSEEISQQTKELPDTDSNITHANLSGIPCACVDNKVNVITGEFVQYDVDFVIPTQNPILFERSYSSSFGKYGTLSLGWNLNHFLDIHLHRRMDDQKTPRYYTAFLNEGQGALTEFLFSDIKHSEKEVRQYACFSDTSIGLTNCGKGEISGKTNSKNMCFFYKKNTTYLKKKKELLSIQEGSKTIHQFQKLKKCPNSIIRKTTFPNGNYIDYNYPSQDLTIRYCELKSSSNQRIENFKFEYIEDPDQSQIVLTPKDGRKTIYVIKKLHHFNCLTHVYRPENPTISYQYKFNKHDSFPRISSVDLPNKRSLQIKYFEPKGHSKANFLNKVRSLYEPVGETADLIETYNFQYQMTDDKSYTKGETEVRDVNNSKTIYGHNEYQRLTFIDKYGLQDKPYRKEKFYWGKGDDFANLVAHTIVDVKGGVQLLHNFVYDESGNPLQEQIHGNLSGLNQRNPMLDANFKPAQTGCEVFTKTCTFSNNDYNLKITEEEGNSKVRYAYYPNSDKVEAKYIYDGEIIKERHFYSYDHQGSVVREIEDDGSTNNVADMAGVSQRLVHYLKNNDNHPTYLPYEQKEVYLDENNQERCAKRVINIYNSFSKLIKQHHYDSNDTLRYTLEWDYDEKGNVIKEINPLGEITQHKYDENKNLIFTQGPNKAYHTKFFYDYMNRLTKVEKVDNTTGETFQTQYKYDKRSNRIATIDEYGNSTQFTYDAFDRLISTTLPEVSNSQGKLFRPIQTIEYDVLGYPVTIKDPLGNITHQENTLRGKPFQITYSDGSQEKLIYNLDGTLKEKVEKNGTSLHYYYDYKKRPTRTETYSSAGILLSTQNIEYNNFHPIKEIDALGHTTVNQYDRQGRLVKVSKEDAEEHYNYDSLGRKNQTKVFFGPNPQDYTLKVCEYDLLNRVIEERVEDAFGTILRKQTCVYDTDGNKIRVDIHTDEGISSTHTSYNILNLPTQIVDPLGNTSKILYRYDYKDSYGVTVPYSETIDPKGNVTISICNTIGKIAKTQKKNSFGELIQQREYFYNGNGQLIETKETVITPGSPDRKVITQWDYNTIGDLIECTEAVGTPEQKKTQHLYNTFGQKIQTIKPDGTFIYFTYDQKGLLATVSSSDNTLSYAYTYDLNDNPIQVADLTHDTQTKRQYDRCDRLIEETLGNALTINYTYDRQGRILTAKLPDNSSIAYSYNPTDLVEVKKLNDQQKEIYSQTYQYDLSGKVKEKQLPFNLGTVKFTYDPLKRYLSTQSPYFSESDVVYDKLGNITSRTLTDPLGNVPCTYSYDDLNQVQKEEGTSTHTYTHDSLSNRVNKDGFELTLNALNQLLQDKQGAYQYDLNGNLAERALQKFTYDAWDRLIAVQDNDKKYTYRYDDIGRRLSKAASTWNPLTNEWTVQDIQYFLFQGENEIGLCDEQKHFSELRILGQGKGGEIGSAIAFEIQGEVYIPITDYVGHTRVLLDKAGQTVDVYRYTVFGEEVILNSKGNSKDPSTAWRYCSKRYDPETKFLYFGKRYYDPSTGRWVTADPLGYDAGPNLYAYSGNNPLILLDIYGLKYDRTEMRRDEQFSQRVSDSLTDYYSRPPPQQNPLNWESFESLTPREEYSRVETVTGTNEGTNTDQATRFGNGMYNSLNEARAHAKYISENSGGHDVRLIYNSSKNFFVDLFECFLGLMGIATQPALLMCEEMNKFHETAPPELKSLWICTSQSAIHVKNALIRVSPEVRQRFLIVAIAPAAYISRNLCADVRHYRAEAWRDLIPRIDFVGSFLNSSTVTTLKSHPNANFFDHSIQSPTYKDVIERHIKRFMQSEGKKM